MPTVYHTIQIRCAGRADLMQHGDSREGESFNDRVERETLARQETRVLLTARRDADDDDPARIFLELRCYPASYANPERTFVAELTAALTLQEAQDLIDYLVFAVKAEPSPAPDES